jgi:hypothetical protein
MSKFGGFLHISVEHVHRVDISNPIGPFFEGIWTGLLARSPLRDFELADFTPQTAGSEK